MSFAISIPASAAADFADVVDKTVEAQIGQYEDKVKDAVQDLAEIIKDLAAVLGVPGLQASLSGHVPTPSSTTGATAQLSLAVYEVPVPAADGTTPETVGGLALAVDPAHGDTAPDPGTDASTVVGQTSVEAAAAEVGVAPVVEAPAGTLAAAQGAGGVKPDGTDPTAPSSGQPTAAEQAQAVPGPGVPNAQVEQAALANDGALPPGVDASTAESAGTTAEAPSPSPSPAPAAPQGPVGPADGTQTP